MGTTIVGNLESQLAEDVRIAVEMKNTTMRDVLLGVPMILLNFDS